MYYTLGALLIFLLVVGKGMAKEKGTTSTPTFSKDVMSLNDIITKHTSDYPIVPFPLVKAIIKVESNWNISAQNPSDPSYGLCQIMPIVAYDYGIIADYKNVSQSDIDKIKNPYNNIYCCVRLLDKLLSKYPTNTAIQMYNVGERGFNQLGYRNEGYLNKVLDALQSYQTEG